MTEVVYVTPGDPIRLEPTLFLLYLSEPDGQIQRAGGGSQSKGQWSPGIVMHEIRCCDVTTCRWCLLQPKRDDCSIICASPPALIRPNIHPSIQTVTASKSSHTPHKTSDKGKSRSHVCQKKMCRGSEGARERSMERPREGSQRRLEHKHRPPSVRARIYACVTHRNVM